MDHVLLTDLLSAPLLRSHSLLLFCKYCRSQTPQVLDVMKGEISLLVE